MLRPSKGEGYRSWTRGLVVKAQGLGDMGVGNGMRGEAKGFLTFVVHLALVCWLTWSLTSPVLNVWSEAALLMVRGSRGLPTVLSEDSELMSS